MQCDLIDFTKPELSSENNNMKYLLNVIDVFSKKAFGGLVPSKHSRVVLNKFKELMDQAGQYPECLVVDKGTLKIIFEICNLFWNIIGAEFKASFKAHCRSKNVKVYSPKTSYHCSHIERFNATIQNKIFKWCTQNQRYDFHVVLGKKTQIMIDLKKKLISMI